MSSAATGTPRPLRIARAALAALVVWQIGLGLLRLAQDLGAVPFYGDTLEYTRMTESLEVDPYRGFAYPYAIAALNRVLPEPARITPTSTRRALLGGDDAPAAGFVVLQLLQTLLGLASLAYFVHVVARPGGRLAGPALLLLVATDPLVAHFQLAVLTDGPSLSAALVFCAASSRMVSDPSRRPLAAVTLLLATAAACGLRGEKAAQLVAVALCLLAAWLWLDRRGRVSVSRRAALLAAGIVLLGAAASQGVQRSLQQPSWRWSFFDWFVHGRVVFPELSTIYDELPPDVRQRITREQARDYDTHIRSARRVINSVSAGDADLRRQLTLEIAAVAWDRRGPAIVLDVLTDALENVLATASFHGRVAYAAWFQEGPIEWGSRTDATTWTWSRIARTHPRTARLHWASSAVLLALAAGLAILERRRGPARAASRRSPARWVAWLPTLVFVAINALAFALAADLLHVRYALLAHAATLVFVYASALEVGRPTQREAAARGD